MNKQWEVVLHVRKSLSIGRVFPVVFRVPGDNAEKAKENALTDAADHGYVVVNDSDSPKEIK